MICHDCGKVLTETESYFFTIRCEDCEMANVIRELAWMDGADDPELDERYGDRPADTGGH